MTKTQIQKIFDKVNDELCKEAWGYLGEFLGIHLEYVDDYFEEDDDAEQIGMFCASCQTDAHIFPIALNLKLINRIPAEDREKEVLLTIYHELGHGLLFFLDDEDFEVNYYGFDEEELAEDFAQAFLNGGMMKTVIWENVEAYINMLEESVS